MSNLPREPWRYNNGSTPDDVGAQAAPAPMSDAEIAKMMGETASNGIEPYMGNNDDARDGEKV